MVPPEDAAFYRAAIERLPPLSRPAFTARVVELLQATCNPGVGEINRAVRAAIAEVQQPVDIGPSAIALVAELTDDG